MNERCSWVETMQYQIMWLMGGLMRSAASQRKRLQSLFGMLMRFNGIIYESTVNIVNHLSHLYSFFRLSCHNSNRYLSQIDHVDWESRD